MSHKHLSRVLYQESWLWARRWALGTLWSSCQPALSCIEWHLSFTLLCPQATTPRHQHGTDPDLQAPTLSCPQTSVFAERMDRQRRP